MGRLICQRGCERHFDSAHCGRSSLAFLLFANANIGAGVIGEHVADRSFSGPIVLAATVSRSVGVEAVFAVLRHDDRQVFAGVFCDDVIGSHEIGGSGSLSHFRVLSFVR